MATVMKVNVDDIDAEFVENLKKDFAHAAIEISLAEETSDSPSLSESDFWQFIKLLDWNKEEDDQIIEPLVASLATAPLSHIYRFSDMLSEKLWKLDTYAHAKVFLDDPEEEGYLSVDDFLYTRCAVVANGQAFYEKLFHNPALMPPDLGFEPLLYVVMKAYKRKTGKKFTAVSAFNYETYRNKEGWQK